MLAFLEVGVGWQALGTVDVQGTDLADRVLRPSTIVKVVWRLLRIVVLMSMRGISHNDIKLENVLLSFDDDVWLIDFDQATTGH